MKANKTRKPIVAITVGDYNGIGPEVALKSLRRAWVRRICRPVLVGPGSVFEFYARRLKLQLRLVRIESSALSASALETMSVAETPFIESSGIGQASISPSKVTSGAGRAALLAIRKAVRLAKSGKVDAIVTAPISKRALQMAGSRLPGHTELLQRLTSARSVAMILVAPGLRVGLMTIHIPLGKVPLTLSRQLLRQRIQVIHDSLVRDWRIRRPRIAVLGLNPHAGEDGTIGLEEKEVVAPVVRACRAKGIRVEGPFAADGFFGMKRYKEFDAVVAMYHDQGLIPLKMRSFATGVNVTAGLPIVRTSPDHGTAFDIAGRGVADPSSMIQAIRVAVQIARNRMTR